MTATPDTVDLYEAVTTTEKGKLVWSTNNLAAGTRHTISVSMLGTETAGRR